MAEEQLPSHIQALLSPDAYPHPVDQIELRQTHISYLLFAGDYVYKLKKPLELGFLDFTTLDKRRHFCEEEVRLNRRLCEGTYLGVVPVVKKDGGFAIEAEGEPVDYAVKMRRLPEERMLSRLLEEGRADSGMLERLARRIADFHESSERNPEIDRFGGLETAMANWRENFEQTAPYIGRTINRTQFEEIKAYVEEVAELDAAIFEQRVQEGRVRDCHGDLRADAVVFENDHVCVFDCIEFNERFRYSDVAADVAFLAMDLDERGRQDLSDEFMGRYLAATLDSTLPLVLDFYKCYRAYVRGKVDGFQLDQPEVSEAQKQQARQAAQRYFQLAHSYAVAPSPRALIITIGVTGSGKSFLANALATRLGAFTISSDVTRKHLVGIDPAERHIEPLDAGIYDPEITERTYAAMLEAARPWLRRGKPVILDASYLTRAHRQAALTLAYETNAAFLALECEADESVIWNRLSEREGAERTVSDGRWEVYRAQQERREQVDELPVGCHVIVDTARPLQEQIETALSHLTASITEEREQPESAMGGLEE